MPAVTRRELAAQLADDAALQPEQQVHAEEREHAEQQAGHEEVDEAQLGQRRLVVRVDVRVERQEPRRLDFPGVAGSRRSP